jgi:hypothetical protein
LTGASLSKKGSGWSRVSTTSISSWSGAHSPHAIQRPTSALSRFSRVVPRTTWITTSRPLSLRVRAGGRYGHHDQLAQLAGAEFGQRLRRGIEAILTGFPEM